MSFDKCENSLFSRIDQYFNLGREEQIVKILGLIPRLSIEGVLF